MQKRTIPNPGPAIARDVAFHAGRLNDGHAPTAVLISALQVLANYASSRPIKVDALEAAIAASMTELDLHFEWGPMGDQRIVPAPGAPVANDARDAARYRWLAARLTHQHCGPNVGWGTDELLPGDTVDDAIDAAMARERADER